jgi:glucosamine--fructose-6-phosphate aminotransferase (isomerizing)
VHIAACGTSYHAGLVASYLVEQICRIPARVEIASEYRYRDPVVTADTLFVTISQSGETADTLAALRNAKQAQYLSTLTICNVAESSMVRESNLVLLTRAGPEIGVASTKAFTTQLTALAMLTIALAKNGPNAGEESMLVAQLLQLPGLVEKTLKLDETIRALAEVFAEKKHALFLGRGPLQAIAMEGALKLKEISYIHAEGYPAAEMKHGPIALVDDQLPVVFVATRDSYHEKIVSNIQEIKARKGMVIAVISQGDSTIADMADDTIVIPEADELMAPMLSVIPLQLLAYYSGVAKGNDVDKPRNLAKSVTVE